MRTIRLHGEELQAERANKQTPWGPSLGPMFSFVKCIGASWSVPMNDVELL
jgi:hypothetical protein